MKNTNKIKNINKIFLTITVIFTLSTSFLTFYYSMDLRFTSMSSQTLQEKENMKKIPSIATKVEQYGDGGFAYDVFVLGPYTNIEDGNNGLEILYVNVVEPTITITAPDNLTSWKIESSHHIFWNWTGYIYTVNIELFKNNSFETGIAWGVLNDGIYYWTLPSNLIGSDDYHIKITDASSDGSVYGISEYFEISYVWKNIGDFTITGYNPILLLSIMGAISVILVLKNRKIN